MARSSPPTIIWQNRSIPTSSCTSARSPTICSRSKSARRANHQPPEHDQHKLRALTDPHLWFAYWIGVYLVLGKTSVVSDVYVGGVVDRPLSAWLAGRLKEAGLGLG